MELPRLITIDRTNLDDVEWMQDRITEWLDELRAADDVDDESEPDNGWEPDSKGYRRAKSQMTWKDHRGPVLHLLKTIFRAHPDLVLEQQGTSKVIQKLGINGKVLGYLRASSAYLKLLGQPEDIPAGARTLQPYPSSGGGKMRIIVHVKTMAAADEAADYIRLLCEEQ